MKVLKITVTLALVVILFSSCSRGYGCPFSILNESNCEPAPIHHVALIIDQTC